MYPVRPLIDQNVNNATDESAEDGQGAEQASGYLEASGAGDSAGGSAEAIPSPEAMDSEGDSPQVAEAQVPKGLPAPEMPTKAQREIHARTHLPYRVWCDICVQGRGQASPHKSPDAAADRYTSPQLHLDYWFIGGQGETGRESLPALVMYEKVREVLFAHRVEQKRGLHSNCQAALR